MLRRILFAAASLLLLLTTCRADTFDPFLSFTATPITVGAGPGQTVNINTTFVNSSPDLWAFYAAWGIQLPTANLGCSSGIIPGTDQCGDDYLNDFIGWLPPQSSVTGLAAQFTWSPTAPEGYSFTGILLGEASWWDSQVNCMGCDPAHPQLGLTEKTAEYKAVVTPEPSTILTMLTGAVGIFGMWRRQRFSK